MDDHQIKPEPADKQYNILVVEDDETSFLLLEAILEPYNCRLLNAVDGKQAVSICISNPNIDLILMDIKLPQIDGYEATRQIRAFNSKVPIIAQTAYALQGDNEKSLAAGCNSYVTKPIVKDDLLKKIGAFLPISR